MTKNNIIITKKTWETLSQRQTELEQLIIQKRNSGSEINSITPPLIWVSCFNVKRLKLCLLVEVGEFANEIKSFKAWHKKPEIDWAKAKEELIDCLCFFLGLVGIYQIDMDPILTVEYKIKDLSFNELLLNFFAKTNDLYIEEDEQFYSLKNGKINEQAKNTYYGWLRTFETVCRKLKINELELVDIYSKKYDKNLERVNAK